ncbi:reverse transcriptase domain-containing protein [Tanacetum coccineum]
MRTRSSSNVIDESFTIPKRRNRRRSKQIVEPEIRTIVETPIDIMADTRTMSELLQAPTEGYGDAIVLPTILADNFELKVGLLQLVSSNQFHGFERDDPHAHIRWFNKLTSTLKYREVPNDAIKLMLFPFSLEGATRTWLEKEPPRSITTWEDLVSKFVNYFFPPSKTTNLKNDITNFQQRFDENFSEAWDRFKDLLHSLNAAVGGNLLNRTPREALTIIENKSKVRTSRNKPVVSKVSAHTSSSTSAHSSKMAALTDAVHVVLCRLDTPKPEPGSFPSNTVANPRGDLKAITTRNGVAYDGPMIPTSSSSPPTVVESEPEVTKDKVLPTNKGSTKNVQPLVVQVLISEFDVAPVSTSKPNPKPSIPYPSRLND